VQPIASGGACNVNFCATAPCSQCAGGVPCPGATCP
jgi:hypothetical protein